MKYDKVNDYVAFKEDTHLYFNLKDPNAKYTSVTTLIGKYHEEFDEEFWSSYKAIEKLIDKEEFKLVKKTLLANKRIPKNLINDLEIDNDLFNETKLDILKSYKKANVEACEKGSCIHKKRELEFYERECHKTEKYTGLNGNFYCRKDDFNLNKEQAIYPEFLIYYHHHNGIFNLAGQVDVLIKDGNDIIILDFKSNSKGIESKAYFNQFTKQTKKMFHPISNIEDTMLMHYTLQLSLYAYMLQELHPEFNIKLLKLIHISDDGTETHIPVEYKKDEVKKLVEFHAKKCKKEYEVNKINFDFLDGEW